MFRYWEYNALLFTAVYSAAATFCAFSPLINAPEDVACVVSWANPESSTIAPVGKPDRDESNQEAISCRYHESRMAAGAVKVVFSPPTSAQTVVNYSATYSSSGTTVTTQHRRTVCAETDEFLLPYRFLKYADKAFRVNEFVDETVILELDSNTVGVGLSKHVVTLPGRPLTFRLLVEAGERPVEQIQEGVDDEFIIYLDSVTGDVAPHDIPFGFTASGDAVEGGYYAQPDGVNEFIVRKGTPSSKSVRFRKLKDLHGTNRTLNISVKAHEKYDLQLPIASVECVAMSVPAPTFSVGLDSDRVAEGQSLVLTAKLESGVISSDVGTSVTLKSMNENLRFTADAGKISEEVLEVTSKITVKDNKIAFEEPRGAEIEVQIEGKSYPLTFEIMDTTPVLLAVGSKTNILLTEGSGHEEVEVSMINGVKTARELRIPWTISSSPGKPQTSNLGEQLQVTPAGESQGSEILGTVTIAEGNSIGMFRIAAADDTLKNESDLYANLEFRVPESDAGWRWQSAPDAIPITIRDVSLTARGESLILVIANEALGEVGLNELLTSLNDMNEAVWVVDDSKDSPQQPTRDLAFRLFPSLENNGLSPAINAWRRLGKNGSIKRTFIVFAGESDLRYEKWPNEEPTPWFLIRLGGRTNRDDVFETVLLNTSGQDVSEESFHDFPAVQYLQTSDMKSTSKLTKSALFRLIDEIASEE